LIFLPYDVGVIQNGVGNRKAGSLENQGLSHNILAYKQGNPLLIDKSDNALYYGWLARIDPASLALYRSKLSIYYRRSSLIAMRCQTVPRLPHTTMTQEHRAYAGHL
jgi:hypothetical protein